MLWLLRSISKRNLLDETKAISMPEKKAEKAIVIRICIIIPIIVSELAYRISSGAICNSFCTVCWCCIFYSENTCVIINLIFCHLLVGFKSITGNDFVFLFNADKFVRIDPFLFFHPKRAGLCQICRLFGCGYAHCFSIPKVSFSRSNRLLSAFYAGINME